MSDPLVTIAIPTYNRASVFLRQSLEAALAQTYERLEILVSDNASADDTEAVVRGYDDPRIRYVRQEVNLGANGNFNYLVDHAAGEFMVLLLDDDLIDPDFVETCVDGLRANPAARMVRTGSRTDKDGRVVGSKRNETAGLEPADVYLAYFRGRTSIYFCTTLFHTATLRELGGLHSKHDLLEDCVAVVEFVARFPRVDVPEPKATFRWHGLNRGSSEAIERWCDDSRSLLDLMVRASGPRGNEVREEGLRFLAVSNYTRLARWKVTDPRAYLHVYRAFERRYHPMPFLVERYMLRRSRRWMRRLSGREIPSSA